MTLTSGAVVVDPGDPAEDAVRLLKLLRYRMMRQAGYSGVWRSLLRRAGSHYVAIEATRPDAGRQGRQTPGSVSRVVAVADPLATCGIPRVA